MRHELLDSPTFPSIAATHSPMAGLQLYLSNIRTCRKYDYVAMETEFCFAIAGWTVCRSCCFWVLLSLEQHQETDAISRNHLACTYFTRWAGQAWLSLKLLHVKWKNLNRWKGQAVRSQPIQGSSVGSKLKFNKQTNQQTTKQLQTMCANVQWPSYLMKQKQYCDQHSALCTANQKYVNANVLDLGKHGLQSILGPWITNWNTRRWLTRRFCITCLFSCRPILDHIWVTYICTPYHMRCCVVQFDQKCCIYKQLSATMSNLWFSCTSNFALDAVIANGEE